MGCRGRGALEVHTRPHSTAIEPLQRIGIF